MWNYTLLQLGLALGRFPQENTLSLPQSQVSQISASFLPIFIHFHPFHLFSFVFLYSCSFYPLFLHFHSCSFIFRKHSVTSPVPGVSDRSRLFTPPPEKRPKPWSWIIRNYFKDGDRLRGGEKKRECNKSLRRKGKEDGRDSSVFIFLF